MGGESTTPCLEILSDKEFHDSTYLSGPTAWRFMQGLSQRHIQTEKCQIMTISFDLKN